MTILGEAMNRVAELIATMIQGDAGLSLGDQVMQRAEHREEVVAAVFQQIRRGRFDLTGQFVEVLAILLPFNPRHRPLDAQTVGRVLLGRGLRVDQAIEGADLDLKLLGQRLRFLQTSLRLHEQRLDLERLLDVLDGQWIVLHFQIDATQILVHLSELRIETDHLRQPPFGARPCGCRSQRR